MVRRSMFSAPPDVGCGIRGASYRSATGNGRITRKFSSYPSDDLAAAREMCEAINRYDKLRMVATADRSIVALFEFSFSITHADRERYRSYGIELDERIDCRFGPCITDAYQDLGLGSALLPLAMDVARRFG